MKRMLVRGRVIAAAEGETLLETRVRITKSLVVIRRRSIPQGKRRAFITGNKGLLLT